MTGLIKVSDADWDKAEAFFKENPDAVKYSKKNDNLKRSFIKVDDEIYVMQSKKYLGKGAFGKVKVVQNRKGENYAVKIEGRGLRSDTNSELLIMRKLGEWKGQAVRKLRGFKPLFKGERNYTNKKLYTIMNLKKGKELFEILYRKSQYSDNYEKKNTLLDITKKLIALQCCDCILSLHQKGIIHRDIKPENFIADISDDEKQQTKTSTIDFGMSLLFDENDKKSYKRSDLAGSAYYMAPEIFSLEAPNSTYSVESDIYALGVMFRDDLDIGKAIYGPMTQYNRYDRPPIEHTMIQLSANLLKLNLDDDVKDTVQNLQDKAKDILLSKMRNPQLLSNAYAERSAGGSNYRDMAKWMYKTSKSIGRRFTKKGKKRNEQLENVGRSLTLLSDPLTEEKAQQFYAFITDTIQNIDKEYNLMDSGLKKVCQNYAKNLEVLYPDIKNQLDPKRPLYKTRLDEARNEINPPNMNTPPTRNSQIKPG